MYKEKEEKQEKEITKEQTEIFTFSFLNIEKVKVCKTFRVAFTVCWRRVSGYKCFAPLCCGCRGTAPRLGNFRCGKIFANHLRQQKLNK